MRQPDAARSPTGRLLAGSRFDRCSDLGLVCFTPRESDVLALLCQRQTDREIAARLFISPRTVATHVSSILAKLGAANRREAAAISLHRGLT